MNKKTLKAIIETKFIKENPQLRREVEDEMKFGNIMQQEAESKVARKHNLHTSTNRTAVTHDKWNAARDAGRWIKMLKKDKEEKMAGAVTSTTAGLETKPRYRRRRRKEEEDDELE